MSRDNSAHADTLRALTKILNTLNDQAVNGGSSRKRPSSGSQPAPKRRRTSSSRHKHRKRRHEERQRVIQDHTEPRQRDPVPRPVDRPLIRSQGRRSSRSPPSRAPEATALTKTAVVHHFHPQMRRALIKAYDKNLVKYKEFAPVIHTRITRGGKKKLSVRFKQVRQKPPASALEDLKQAPSGVRVRHLSTLLHQLERRFLSSKFLKRNFVIFKMFQHIIFSGAEIETLQKAGFAAVIRQEKVPRDKVPWFNTSGGPEVPDGYQATRSL